MRYTTSIACAIVLAGCAGCSTTPPAQPGAAGQNTTETMAPADEQASKPGNAGNGLGYGMSPGDADVVFDTLDANHDGVVSRDEFMVNGDSGQRFPGCDVDGDGKLTRQELEQCAAQPPTTGH